MVATRGRTFKRPWRRSCHSSKLKSSSAPIGRKDSWCFHAVGSSNAPLLGSTAAEGLQRIGRTSIATRWRSCGLPQSASCSENFVIPPDVFGQTLRHLDRRDQAVARGFFLTGWSGTQPYTLDRITRGTRHIAAVCISVLGNSQPARIAEYVKRVNTNDTGGDGLLQRFGLMAWPDTHPDWKDVDRNPDSRAREDAWKVFDRLSSLDTRGRSHWGHVGGRLIAFRFF